MPHINQLAGEYDNTASAYIVLTEAGQEPRLWLHMHRILHMWLQFGGHIEKSENPWQTLVHEIKEESGYDMAQLKILQPKIRLHTLSQAALHPQPVADISHEFDGTPELHYHNDRGYAFVTDQQPSEVVAAGESPLLRTMTAAEIRSLGPNEIPSSTREIGLFILETILFSHDQVDPGVFQL